MREVTSSRRLRAMRRGSGLVAAIAIALTAAGCADGTDPGSATHAPGTSTSGAPSARLRTPTQPVTVIHGTDPAQVSVGLSRALFATAPVVVVARAGDRAGVRRGTHEAARLGAPLLLTDAGDMPTSSAIRTSSPASPLAAEIARLQARAVLAAGASVARTLRARLGVRVVTEPARLPATSAAHRSGGLAILVRSGAGRPPDPIVASADAAGARVIPVQGADLRADPTVISELAKQQPRQVVALGGGFGPTDRLAQRVAAAKTGVQLPDGGQKLFPGHRLVALYGYPGTPALGVLGDQGLTAGIARAKRMAAEYQPLSKVPVVPAFEIIATIADSAPGPDGNYSDESTVASLRPWVKKAGAAGMYVVLDLQAGRANLLDQAKLYAPLLRLPYVGLALDPEWKLTANQLPLRQIGSVDATQINAVSAWLATLTAKNKLPQKLLVLHQFKLSMIRDEKDLDLRHDDLQILIHMDGQGTPSMKDATWRAVKAAAPKGIPLGWKNFYREDHPMLSPAQTMAKRPAPLMISYQ